MSGRVKAAARAEQEQAEPWRKDHNVAHAHAHACTCTLWKPLSPLKVHAEKQWLQNAKPAAKSEPTVEQKWLANAENAINSDDASADTIVDRLLRRASEP
eukprot:scaffold14451_cov64-Phaeocystis_antarctica.AAC.3